MMLPALTNQYALMVQTRNMTKDLYTAQQSAEQTITDVKTAIQNGTVPDGQTRTPYVLFHGQSFQRTVYGYPNQIGVHVGNTAINLNAVVADNRMPIFDVAIASNVNIVLSDGTNVLPFAYVGTPFLQIDSSFDLLDPNNVDLTNISRWYVSREGFNIPMIPDALEIEKGTVYPRFPDDYVLIKGATGYNLTTLLTTYAGRHLIYNVTPASTSGKMGATVVSNPVFLSGLPVITSLKLHLDASMISKEDSTAVRSVTSTVNGATVQSFYVAKWNDISGNGNNAIQNTSATQPQLIEASMGQLASGGLNYETYAKYVQFNGSKGMTVADTASLDLTNLTVIVVARSSDRTAQKTIVSKLSGSTGWFVGWNASNQLGWYISNSGGKNSISADADVGLDGGWHILMGSSALAFQVDDGTANTTARTVSQSITNNSPVTIGFNGSSSYSNVDIAEVLIYDGTLSATDSANILTYLKDKYQPTPIVSSIYALKPITDTAVKGEAYAMPTTVQAYMSDGTLQDVAVTWSPASIDTSTVGMKTSTATAVVDSTKTTTLQVDVEAIASLENLNVTVERSTPFTMPTTVVADLVNGAKQDVGVTWNIGSVDTSTLGTVIRTGTAVLDPTKTMTLTVTIVPRKVTSVTFDRVANTLNIGSGFQLTATVLPTGADNTNVTWSSSNTAVATVNGSGWVTTVGGGTATITVTTVDGGFTDTCAVTVNVPVTGVSLNRTSITLARNAVFTLIATISPPNATNQSVTWSSSNTSVATVSSSGVVTVNGGATIGGTTVITVTTADGSRTATCTVTAGTAVTGVTIPVTLTVHRGSTSTLTPTISPSGATVTSVTWSSSNTSVATVNSSGLVTGVGAGTATITVTTVDGGFTDTCAVTVDVSVTGVSLNETALTLARSAVYTLIATVSPSDATNQSVTWSSSNTAVATVSSGGVVTVKSAATIGATTVITVTTVDGSRTATCTIMAGTPVTGVTLPSTLTVNPGSPSTLTPTISPSGATNKTVTWSSSNTSVATVSSSGVVTAVSGGTATITVTTVDNGFTANCVVTVPLWAKSISSGSSSAFTVTFDKSMASASFTTSVSGTTISVSGTQVIVSRTSSFSNNTNYSILATAADGTSRTITVSRNVTNWTVTNN